MPKFISDQDFIDQLILLIDRLSDIEQNYWWWFNSRHGMPHQDHDHLHNHIDIDYIGFNRLDFKFVENSELSDEIKLKCYEAYLNTF